MSITFHTGGVPLNLLFLSTNSLLTTTQNLSKAVGVAFKAVHHSPFFFF